MDQLPLARPRLGTWPKTQACALTGNRTGDLLACGTVLNALNQARQRSLSPFSDEETEP